MEFSGTTEKFNADLTLVDDPKSKEVIDALGYQNINGNFSIAGTWQPTDGKLELSQYDISVDNAGTLGMTFDLGGYTLDFIKSMQEMQKQMAAQPAGADNSAQGMAMLGLMQQLIVQQRLDPLRRRFADQQGAGLCRQAARHVGQRTSPTRPRRSCRSGMAQLNNPELTAEVTSRGRQISRRSEEPRDFGRAAGSRSVRADHGGRDVQAAGPAEDARRHVKANED